MDIGIFVRLTRQYSPIIKNNNFQHVVIGPKKTLFLDEQNVFSKEYGQNNAKIKGNFEVLNFYQNLT